MFLVNSRQAIFRCAQPLSQSPSYVGYDRSTYALSYHCASAYVLDDMHLVLLDMLLHILRSMFQSFVSLRFVDLCCVDALYVSSRLSYRHTTFYRQNAEARTQTTFFNLTRLREGLGGLIPKLRPLFCRVPWGAITRSSWSSRPFHLCRFTVRSLHS